MWKNENENENISTTAAVEEGKIERSYAFVFIENFN